ncbi:HNH endonuclease [Belliella pelovolcani]|uniref:HNH domain-containing protein n=1 Tax=Belliella pelovolcani TaxID=529505 RepID=A0A1N7PS44_9BACT|nr:HNH endonuclease [Belliella pelovolcani]SIT13380.1 hypothetical protein SAMN05421761_1202 [Belliella pelovolcani]
MSELPFREVPPKRSYAGKKLSDYRRYKDFLAQDFENRCGYTYCLDFWFGGKPNFQIDHFKPKSKFPDLETDYDNLVYSCSFVNRAKSDDVGSYLDPVNEDYNTHFYRDELGNIYPRTESEAARYMYIRLKLYLKRHSIIWMLDQLEQRMFILQELIEHSQNELAKSLLVEVTMRYNNYKRHLRAIQ